MEKTQGAGDAHGSGAGISTQQEQQQQQRTQQLVPESYMVPETAVREGNVSGMRRMQSGGPAQAQVGSMTMQVTQTRRTIFPGATGNSIMRAVGHDIQYQHPGEMLQLHTYLRCNTEALLTDRADRIEELQNQKAMLEQNDLEIRRLNYDLEAERTYSANLKDKVEVFQAMTHDYQSRCRKYEEYNRKIAKIQEQLREDRNDSEHKCDVSVQAILRDINGIADETKKSRTVIFAVEHTLMTGCKDMERKFSSTTTHLMDRFQKKAGEVALLARNVDRAIDAVKALNESRDVERAYRRDAENDAKALTEKLAQTEKHKAHVTTQRDLAWREIEEMRKSQDERKIRVESLLREKNFYHSESTRLEGELDNVKRSLQTISDEKIGLKSLLTLAETRLKKEIDDNERLREENEKVTKSSSERQIKIDESAVALASKDEDLAGKQEEIQRLLAHVSSMRIELDEKSTALTKKQAFVDETLSREQAAFDRKKVELETAAATKISQIKQEYDDAKASLGAAHSSELKVMQQEKTKLEQAADFHKQNSANQYAEFKSKEAYYNRVEHEQGRKIADLEAEVQKSEKLLTEVKSTNEAEMSRVIEEHKLELAAAVAESKDRAKLDFQHILDSKDERHQDFEQAAEQEIASIKRQYEEALQRKDEEHQQQLEEAQLKRSTADRDKRKHSREMADMREYYEKQVSALQTQLKVASDELAARKTQEMLARNDDEIVPPVIHKSDKIQEMTETGNVANNTDIVPKNAAMVNLIDVVDDTVVVRNQKRTAKRSAAGRARPNTASADRAVPETKKVDDENAFARTNKTTRGQRAALRTLSGVNVPPIKKNSAAMKKSASSRYKRRTQAPADEKLDTATIAGRSPSDPYAFF